VTYKLHHIHILGLYMYNYRSQGHNCGGESIGKLQPCTMTYWSY